MKAREVCHLQSHFSLEGLRANRGMTNRTEKKGDASLKLMKIPN